MNDYKTPGVIVKETSLLPASVVQVSTAVPVFLGYAAGGEVGKPVRITSLKEYEDHFGAPAVGIPPVKPSVGKTYAFPINASGEPEMPETDFFLYEAMQIYFMNGGGACYIIKVGDFGTTISATDFTAPDRIPSIEKLDEPTLICFPEAVKLDASDYALVTDAALTVCYNTKEKFTIIDSPRDLDLLDFNPMAGLETYRTNAITSTYTSYGASYYPPLKTVAQVAVDDSGFPAAGSAARTTLESQINAVNRAIIPPSAFMAGVYAKVDRERGVWKAPANVSLQGAVEPTVAVSDAAQGILNVDSTAGKSINAIRQFRGKGTVVWGARTLDGNNNEWRYVNVRRLFITVEESVKKAVSQFVFENNDAKTWSKVSSMIKSYLNGLWKDGALMGAAPEEAYFVEVGLGSTMSQQDILEGRMIVKIGLAAVRPAEFIILEFSHFVNQ